MDRSPEELDFLRSGAQLGLLAEHVVDGVMIGLHKGTRRGTGSEFNQYRSYQPGDDIRQIDWKMFARSDRYYIKESETESSITLRFFLDASASMNYEEAGYTRFQYASLVIAAFATIGARQGDALALHMVNSKEHRDLQAKRGRAQLNRLLHDLENMECAGHWPEQSEWLTEQLNTRKRELWVVCSDLLDGEKRWQEFVNVSRYAGHEVIFLQILGRQERHLDGNENVNFKDPETGIERNINTGKVRERYLQKLNAYQENLEASLLSPRSQLYSMTMDESVKDAVLKFLKRRQPSR